MAIAFFAVCIAVGVLAVRLVYRNRPMTRKAVVLRSVLCTLILAVCGMFMYFEVYYHAGADAAQYLEDSNTVTVSRTQNGYLFDGPGEGSAVIFYPGAKVEETAYAPLLYRLAASGEDCFLVKMPFRFAIFGSNAATDLIRSYEYGDWYIAGHSMGGVCASLYAAKHPEEIKGIILLASYPGQKLAAGTRLLSLYGSEDGCLSRTEYEKSRPDWPDDSAEQVIAGGNHAYFGDYGEQDGDGQAAITDEDQQTQTAAAILTWLGK